MPDAIDTVEPTAAAAPKDLATGARRAPVARSDRAYWGVLYVTTFVFVFICIAFLVTLISSSIPAWRHSGIGLITSSNWDPQNSDYGALSLIVGTLETSLIALILGIPIGITAAVSIVHLVPRRLQTPLSSFVELLAAVPSVVYGMVGVVVLAPYFQADVLPWLQSVSGGFFLFSGTLSGYSILLAGVVLTIMVLPTIVALSRDAIARVPQDQVEGALSVGATKWQTLYRVVVPDARAGITGAVTLAAARALGETIAVAMVIGGNYHLSSSVAQGGATIAATIAQTFDGATALTISALAALAVILIAITATVNYAGRRMLHRAERGAYL
jgi:phosphate transport system permease protein